MGLGGITAAALTAGSAETPPTATAAGQAVETHTVVVRTVEYRIKRMRPKHRQHSARAATTRSPANAATTPSPAPVQAAPVVRQPSPTVAAPAPPTSIRTRASGGDDSGHQQRGRDDAAEHQDD
jgi:hypothetical protein